MNIKTIVEKALDKRNFETLQGYIDFAQHYLDFIDKHLQAVIVSQNENNYQFYQYDRHGNFQIKSRGFQSSGLRRNTISLISI